MRTHGPICSRWCKQRRPRGHRSRFTAKAQPAAAIVHRPHDPGSSLWQASSPQRWAPWQRRRRQWRQDGGGGGGGGGGGCGRHPTTTATGAVQQVPSAPGPASAPTGLGVSRPPAVTWHRCHGNIPGFINLGRLIWRPEGRQRLTGRWPTAKDPSESAGPIDLARADIQVPKPRRPAVGEGTASWADYRPAQQVQLRRRRRCRRRDATWLPWRHSATAAGAAGLTVNGPDHATSQTAACTAVRYTRGHYIQNN